MPGGFYGGFGNTWGARVERGEIKPVDDCRDPLEIAEIDEAVGLFREYSDTLPPLSARRRLMAKTVKWLEEYREMKKAGLDAFVYDPDRPHPL